LELHNLGMKREDFEETIFLYEDNYESIRLFLDIGSQWRKDQGYAYALDYSILYQKLDRMKISPERADELEADIRVLEDAALAQMRSDRD